MFQQHNDEVCALVKKGYAPGTLVRFKTVLMRTRDYIRDKYSKGDMELGDLDHTFVQALEDRLLKIKLDHFTP